MKRLQAVFNIQISQRGCPVRRKSTNHLSGGTAGMDAVGTIPSTDELSRMDYCGNMVYDRGESRLFLENGYVTFDITTNASSYHFYQRDHLGNNRVVFNQTGTVEQVTHYYPFGGVMRESTNPGLQPYKYGGKELDRTSGLDAYDFGARMYFADRLQWGQMDPLCEKYYDVSPYGYCHNNPIIMFDQDGKQPVKYIDSNGKKHISWSVVILVKAPKEGASQKKISRHEEFKHNLIEQYAKQFNHYLNGDGTGVTNTSNVRIVSDFEITVVEVGNPYDSKEARRLPKEYGQKIKEEGGKNGDAAVFMKGSTNGALGLTKLASLITIASNAVEGTESHELFHTSGISDNGYTHGGILNSPPEPIAPEEVDKLWDILPERKY